MKLVEILARELEVWPEGAQELGQWPAGEICIRAASTGHPCTEVYTSTNIADDVDAWCTRPQWQAERDRMSKMEALTEARDNPPSIEHTYEQQLWDRVAQSYFTQLLRTNAGVHWSHKAQAEFSADAADAFMAERTKRVGK